MKLLLDAALSWRLAGKLKAYFTDCRHVDKTGLTMPAKDAEIWAYALQHNFVLVTNDDDFFGSGPCKRIPAKAGAIANRQPKQRRYLIAIDKAPGRNSRTGIFGRNGSAGDTVMVDAVVGVRRSCCVWAHQQPGSS